KVVDFGIAKYFGGAETRNDARLTQTGEYLGTPSFIAPERVVGGPDDGRSDVFSLGAMLYELICGALPWTRQQQLRMSAGLAHDLRPMPMEGFRPGVPEALEELVRRSLAQEAAERPTAAEFAAELNELAETLDDTPAQVRAKRGAPEPTSDFTAANWPDDTDH